MTTPATTATLAQFQSLFNLPTIEGMLRLDDVAFEGFVQHVFECAGYAVENVARQHFPLGPGVDLNLYASDAREKPLARVEVRRYKPANMLVTDDVMAFIGKLHVANDVPGFMVTTSGFNKPAQEAARMTHGNVSLIDGEHLIRYINYVRGSQLYGGAAPVSGQSTSHVSPVHILAADGIQRLDPAKTTVIAVANNKGGVAKTTTALNIALSLAEKHQQRVLLVDMDGQTSLTRLLPLPGPPPPAPLQADTAFLSEYFAGRRGLQELIRPTRFDRVWLIPAHENLFKLDKGGSAAPDGELAFLSDLHNSRLVASDNESFDWIILDTPPAQSYFTRLALASCHQVLLPANAEALATLGASRALATAASIRGLVGYGVDVLGCVVTEWKKNRESLNAEKALKDFAGAEGIRVCLARIPRDGYVEMAHTRTLGGWLSNLFHVAARPGPAARAYDMLVEEVLSYVHRA